MCKKCPQQENPETGSKSVVARGWEWESGGTAWDMVSFWGDENALRSESGAHFQSVNLKIYGSQ